MLVAHLVLLANAVLGTTRQSGKEIWSWKHPCELLQSVSENSLIPTHFLVLLTL